MNEEYRNSIKKVRLALLSPTPSFRRYECSDRRRSSARSFFDDGSRPAVYNTLVALSNIASTTTSTAMAVVNAPKPVYKTYPQRWLILSTVCLLALSNATQWISFAPLHDATTKFYCMNDGNGKMPENDCLVEYWTSQIFQLVGVLTGIFGMFITDKYGIRVSCFCGSILNFLGAVIRVISSIPQTPYELRLPILYTGQVVAATSQPFFLCLSPKVAEYWFDENQRTLANALSFIANPFGVVVGSVAPVIFVSSKHITRDSNGILLLNSSLLALAFLVLCMSFGIRTSKPPTPPSASSDCRHKPHFFDGLYILFRTPIFYIQMVTFGMALALQWSIFITADKMLTKLKYFDKVTGYLLALSAFSGSIASILAGYLVDRSKRFKEVIIICYVGIAIVAISANIFLRHPKTDSVDTLILVILLVMLGFFAIPVFPISLELGVESTFPVAEATSSGILIIAGQLALFLTTYVMQKMESFKWIYSMTELELNYQLSIDFWTLAAVFSASFACIFLRPRYHRLEYEENPSNFNMDSLPNDRN